MILMSLALSGTSFIPPRGLSDLSNLFVITGEGRLYDAQSPVLLLLKSCLVEAWRQLNPQFHQGTILGERSALAGQLATVCSLLQSSMQPPHSPLGFPVVSLGVAVYEPGNLQVTNFKYYVSVLWSDKEILCDPYQLVTRPPVLSFPSAKPVTPPPPFLLLITNAGPLPNLEC